MSLTKQKKDQLKDMSFVEIAYAVLMGEKKAVEFRKLLSEATSILGLTNERVQDIMAQCYTDVNVDGRFINVEGKWGLKSWYPVDQIDEETTAPKVKKKKGKVVEDEMDDYIAQDEEEFTEYEEEYDEIDLEEEDDIEKELDEDVDVDLDEESEEEPLEVPLEVVEEEEEALADLDEEE